MSVKDGQPVRRKGRRPALGRASRGERGSTYLMVVGAAMIVSLLGLSAILLTRIAGRATVRSTSWAEAGTLAHAATEQALVELNSNANWRTEYQHGVTAVEFAMGGGLCRWELQDEWDGDLSNNSVDPVRLYAVGEVGDTARAFSVVLVPSGAALDVLRPVLHSAGNISVVKNKSVTASGGPVSTNATLTLGSGALVDGDVEAQTLANNGGEITGSTTVPAGTKVMPSQALFNLYKNLATRIPDDGPITREVISPGHNPWGTPDPNGLYYLETGSSDLLIRNSRIHGTLVIQTVDGAEVQIEETNFIQNYRPDFPTLIVNGTVELSHDSAASDLSESAEGVNFNPPGAPYQGVSDSDQNDTYPNEIQGLIYVQGGVGLSYSARVRGTVVLEDNTIFNGASDLIHEPEILSIPPVGYSASTNMAPVTGTWRWDSVP